MDAEALVQWLGVCRATVGARCAPVGRDGQTGLLLYRSDDAVQALADAQSRMRRERRGPRLTHPFTMATRRQTAPA